jgi:hypothetical protein
MGHVTYRSLSRVSSVLCYAIAFVFLFATIASINNFFGLVFFAILTGACVCSGIYFSEQQQPMEYRKIR